MENKRPRLDDIEEFKIIKDIYFIKDNPFNNEIDSIEKLERMESKERNCSKSSR